MLEIYEGGVIQGTKGRHIGYVTGNGAVFKGGFNFEGGNQIGYCRGNSVYRGGWPSEGGHYVGSVRWHELTGPASVYKSKYGLYGDEDELFIGRVERDGSLFGGGYVFVETQKYLGFAQNLSWDAPHVHGAGAAILLLLNG